MRQGKNIVTIDTENQVQLLSEKHIQPSNYYKYSIFKRR